MNFYKLLIANRKCKYISRLCHAVAPENAPKPRKKGKLSHSKQLERFFQANKDLKEIRQYIPAKYLQLKRGGLEQLYLICPKAAKTIASHLKPTLEFEGDQIIAETNAGLGLIATELLEDGAKLVRMYESCPEFITGLKDFGSVYPGRVELFTKNIFHLSRYAYIDKQDHGNRVEALLKNVPQRSWVDEPVMTIVGTMPKLSFLRFLAESLALQNEVSRYGRIQIFAIIKPRQYAILSAKPTDNLRAYQSWTILYNLLFDFELLEKFPRNVFLPWEPPLSNTLSRCYPSNFDPDNMYFVKINFKKDLPVDVENLLALHYFIKQLYGRGSNRVIPTIEKWVPGCGLDIIVPKLKHADYFEDIDIFTQFRELTPNQILSVFKEMISNSGYSGSPFTAMIESEVLKSETIETVLSESGQQEKNIIEDVEEKLDEK